eukprot:Em0093g6a
MHESEKRSPPFRREPVSIFNSPVISDEKIFRGTSIHIAQRRAFGREYCRYTERRILTFLGFAKLHAGASNPELRLVSDLELVKRFFHYLENERQSSSGNQFAYCLSFLRAMRYLKSDSDTIKTVQQWCRTYQKAYECKDRSWQRLEAEGKWLAWDAVLEVLKQQRELYESSGPCELTRAQESQKYTVLLLVLFDTSRQVQRVPRTKGNV